MCTLDSPRSEPRWSSWRNRGDLGLFFILVIGCFLRFFRLSHQALWFDETFSVTVASETDLSELIRWMALDVHPPLYYICLHPFLQLLGDGPLGARSLSSLSGCLTLVALPFVARDLGLGRKGTLFATFLLAFSPLHIYYSQEARMYILAALEALLAIAAFYLALDQDRWRDWGIYLLATIASLYTHLYAVFLLLGEGLYLGYRLVQKPRLPRRTFHHYLMVTGFLLFLLTPLWLIMPSWLGSPALGGARIASPIDLPKAWEVWGAGMTALPTPGLPLLAHPIFQIAGPVLLGGLCLIGLYPFKHRPGQRSAAPLLALIILSFPLPGMLLSWGLQRPYWAEKTLVIVAPMVYLLAGIGAARLISRRFLLCIALIFLAVNLYSLYPHYFVRVKSTIAKVVQPLYERAGPADLVILDPFWYVIEFDYSYRKPIHRLGYYFEDGDHFVYIQDGYKNARLLTGTVPLGQYSRIWLWGPAEDLSRLCPYSPQAEFWHYNAQCECWQKAEPCSP